MYQLLKRISRHYRVTLLTFLEFEHEREFLGQVEPLCEKVVAIRRIPPLRWQLFAYEPFDEFLTPQMSAAVRDSFEERDYHLVQLEYSQMGCYADRALGIPTVVTKHEVDFAACGRRARVEQKPWQKLRWFYNYLQVLDREIRLLRNVDAAVCMTDTDARELQKYCRKPPVHVINTGVDLEFFTVPAHPASAPRLVFVGAFQHEPNVDAMLHFCRRVLPSIRDQMPGTELLIVGSNPPPAVSSLADIPGVQVTGYVEDIRPYMASCSVYVVPLRLGVGIRGKILEAWSMAMAVVATPVACAGLRYEHGKNLLLASSDESFAAQVLELLGDAPRRERLGLEGRRTVEEHYSWEASALRLRTLYDSLIGPQRATASSEFDYRDGSLAGRAIGI